MENIFHYQTPIGEIAIAENDGQITNLYFATETVPTNKHELKETDVLNEAHRQLQEYFEGKRKNFSLSLAPSGTEFMQKVWEALLEIPYGETASYKEIAEKINHKLAYRAVGLANNKNPIPIIIPCHRVIGADKKLTGYAGGLEVKKYLLDIEKNL